MVGHEALPLRTLVGLTAKPTVEMPHIVLPSIAKQLFQWRIADFPAAELDYIRYSSTLDGARMRAQTRWQPHYSVADAVQAALRLGVYDGGSEASAGMRLAGDAAARNG